MKILELKEGYYHLARDGEVYYLAVPDRYVVKLKPREVKDYLKWGVKEIDKLAHFLAMNDRKLEARNLPGIDLGDALRQYRSGTISTTTDYTQMRVVQRSNEAHWAFFECDDRYFMKVHWTSGMADMTFVLELNSEEVASYRSRTNTFPADFARKMQDAAASSELIARRFDRDHPESADVVAVKTAMMTALYA